jgi:hypothetical protein
MAQQIIDIGATANDGQGDPLRNAMDKVNDNFTEVYTAGPVGSNVRITNNSVVSTNTNGNIAITPAGLGKTLLGLPSKISIAGGSNGYFLTTDGNGNLSWANTTAAVGTALPIYTGNLAAGNANIANDLVVQGNLTVNGNTVTINTTQLDVEDKTITVAYGSPNGAAADGSGLVVAGANATILYNHANSVWTTNLGLSVNGNITGTGLSVSDATVYGNVDSINGNFTGNVTANYFVGNGSQLTGLNTNSISNGNSNVSMATANGNVTVTASGTETWTFGTDGDLTLPGGGSIDGSDFDIDIIAGNDGDSTYGTVSLVTNSPIGPGTNSLTFNSLGEITVSTAGANDGLIKWVGNSSGDGNGFTTMVLVPDTTVEGNDQYLIIDPTYGPTSGHIHIRAGGTQDNSTADLYLGGENSYVKIPAGENPPIHVSANNQNWTFNTDGTTIFPTLTVTRGDRTGTLTGQTLLFGDATQEAIISTPNGDNDNNSSQRFVINPGAGADGTTGEGGDIYLYAGRGGNVGGSGGDIKIRGGLGPVNGAGGYINIEGGEAEADGVGGYIEIFGGYSGNAAGGYLDLRGGFGQTEGGAVFIQGGYGQTGPGGPVNITGGSSGNGLAEYGNVGVIAGASGWVFDNTGNVTLPRGGVVYETNIPTGGLDGNTIALKPSGGIDADQQLLIYPTAGPVTDNNHLHLTSGNLYNTELFLGNDDLYVKLANTGNIVVNSNDGTGNTAQWTFDATGNLTVPGNIIVTTGIVGSGASPAPSLSGFSSLSAADISATGNITGNYILGNGSQLTGLPASYTDANVVTLLGAFGSNTIVTTGNITAGNIDAGYVYGDTTEANVFVGGTANISGNISGNYILGNAAFMTGIPASYGNANVADFLDSLGSNVIVTTGNITGGNLISTNAVYANIDVVVGNRANVSATKTRIVSDTDFSYIQTGNGTVGSTGNIVFSPYSDPTQRVVINTSTGNLTATGNVSGNYILGNGAFLTGIAASYGNANVATFLASYGSNTISTTGNITAGNLIGNISITSNVTGTSANVDIVAGSYTWSFNNAGNLVLPGNAFTVNYANGTAVTLGSGSSYGDSNVTTLLSSLGSNAISSTANITTTGNISGGNIITGGQIQSSAFTGGNISWAANNRVDFQGAIKVGGTGQILSPGGAASITLNNNGANIPVLGVTNTGVSTSTTTGALIVSGGAGVAGNLYVGGTATTGISAIVAGATNTLLANTVAGFTGNVNNYTQVTFQNKSTGADATADFILTADNGSDTVNYGDFGIINSGYDANTPTNSLGNIVSAADTYLYAQGNLSNASQSGGNLVIGTTTAGKSVKIFAGGANNSALVANISNTGVAITGAITATGNITANNITGSSANVTITANAFVTTFDTTGLVTFPGPMKLAVYANTTVRDSSIPSPSPGMMIYVTGTGMQVRGATSWNTIAGSGT